MIAYEFYKQDQIRGYQLLGILPERRQKQERITHLSILNWARMILDNEIDIAKVFLLRIEIVEDTGEIVHLGPLEAFHESFH
jgi:hypothetical protein